MIIAEILLFLRIVKTLLEFFGWLEIKKSANCRLFKQFARIEFKVTIFFLIKEIVSCAERFFLIYLFIGKWEQSSWGGTKRNSNDHQEIKSSDKRSLTSITFVNGKDCYNCKRKLAHTYNGIHEFPKMEQFDAISCL